MECNKDEAVRSKEIAEKKFSEKNYVAAKKFVMKAKNLYPGLDGISQMITTLDVYISADAKIGGESDWYSVLGVSPLADDESIRKQYRKLALILHPDKNKALGAEGAFKLVSEAWSLLSDKNKRFNYNQKRNSTVVSQPHHNHKAPAPAAARTSGTSTNGYQRKNSASKQASAAAARASFGASAAVPRKSSDTFWTICDKCMTHYEYMRMYLNHTLLCPNCHEAFSAVERDPPHNIFKQSNWSSSAKPPPPPPPPQPQPPAAATTTSFQWGPFSQTPATSLAAAQAASVVQQASEKVKRQREAERERSQVNVERPMKRSNMENGHLNGHGNAANGFGNHEVNRVFIKPNSIRELSYPELKTMLMHKARTKIAKFLRERKPPPPPLSNVNKKQKRASDRAESQGEEKVVSTTESINVPDSDFHNFDLDRAEDSFKEEQVWASYDDDDGMPRFYGRVHRVISLDPFSIRISWLNSRSNTELGPMDWIGSGFTKTSGEFRAGKNESVGSLNSFSHRVNWEKGPRGSIRIYPKKGEVWALYKNWSSEWNEKTPVEVIHKYEMVGVVEDFAEELGVPVVPLHKVPGFKTVFRSHLNGDDPKEVRTIPKEELFRLSHQVPYHVLTGEEAENAPEGCLELDPAATPLELIQAENGVATEIDSTADEKQR